MIIGITGGTGCGKTTLLELIKAQGGVVLDCDAIYHRLLAEDPSLTKAIESRFPGTVTGGVLDRKKLGNIVFSDKKALSDLNAITHSAVKQEVERQLARQPALAAIDAIALFEGQLAPLCHVTVGITAPLEDRVKRLMARDGISEDYARARIAAQHDSSWFAERCDRMLENARDLQAFERICLDFLQSLDIIKAK